MVLTTKEHQVETLNECDRSDDQELNVIHIQGSDYRKRSEIQKMLKINMKTTVKRVNCASTVNAQQQSDAWTRSNQKKRTEARCYWLF